MIAVETWEAAWTEYVEALAALDETRPDCHRRGHVRAHNKNKTRLKRASRALRKLAPDFCDRLGIATLRR